MQVLLQKYVRKGILNQSDIDFLSDDTMESVEDIIVYFLDIAKFLEHSVTGSIKYTNIVNV